MKFSIELSKELSKHSSRAKREEVASFVYWAMKGKGFNIAIVNDKGFENQDKEPAEGCFNRRVYWMRRNNGIDCWEIA